MLHQMSISIAVDWEASAQYAYLTFSLSLLCSPILQLPIIPIGTALSFLLLFVLYAAFVTDLHRQCSAPLHGFAIISLLLFLYAPNHRTVKYHLFAYSRERDGPTRPRGVRVYDQIFQTVCILYIYCKCHLLVYYCCLASWPLTISIDWETLPHKPRALSLSFCMSSSSWDDAHPNLRRGQNDCAH